MTDDLRVAGSTNARKPLQFSFDGQQVAAFEGDMVAYALLSAGIRSLRRNPVDGTPRGVFCTMGLCQDCAVLVDGQVIEACRLPVAEGLTVNSLP